MEDSAHAIGIEGNLYRSREIESFDTGCVEFTLNDGTEHTFQVSHAFDKSVSIHMVIKGERGSLRMNEKGTVIASNEGEVFLDIPPLFGEGQFGGRDFILPNVFKEIDGEEANICSLELGRAHVNVVSLIHDQLSVTDIPQSMIEKKEKGGKETTSNRERFKTKV